MFLFLALACDGGNVKVADSGENADFVDIDGDGYLASIDCDDEDPAINQGADDIAGDGIDQDCDGADDIDVGPDDTGGEDSGGEDTGGTSDDQDGDGFPAAVDCDDDDDTVYPGAEEVLDDGVDQDCDGKDAFDDDVDDDGYDYLVDCDDEDASVNPGATEVYDDGIDQDCDGLDAVTEDVDGDGYGYGVDCDDGDPAINPGATEVAEDGIDQDCDGEDDPLPADADGDGYANETYYGTDCDDGDATVSPGASETVGDDIDSDCDGADYGVDGLAAGDLVITEIMYDPDAVSDSDGEWFEVYNNTAHSVNLKGLVGADDSAYAAADIFSIDVDLVAESGARLVFGISDDTTSNGGISVDFDYAGGGVSFNNGGDELYIGVDAGRSYTTIDSVSFDETTGWPAAKGMSIELKDTTVSASSNDSSGNWCKATATAGSTTDLGSPGAASSGC